MAGWREVYYREAAVAQPNALSRRSLIQVYAFVIGTSMSNPREH
jgi:hypothetical protein